ncbi:MAG: leucyl aminopeptidase family protein [Leptospirales bacterium]|nr:leucyl aminopeptidase family protein [Leptospirales bacterium]
MAAAEFQIEFLSSVPQRADLWICLSLQAAAANEEDKPVLAASDALQRLATASATPILELLADERFCGEQGKHVALNLAGAGQRDLRSLTIGLGPEAKLRYHRVEASIARVLRNAVHQEKIGSVFIDLPFGPEDPRLPALWLAAAAAVHQFCYRSRETRKPGPAVERLQFVSSSLTPTRSKQLAAELTATLRARSLAMDLVNMPANAKRTSSLAEEARALAAFDVEARIQEDLPWIKTNMPCFYTVARGSLQSDPPRWIHCIYRPSGTVKHRIALVGKGVIFDTGGYQVKPDDYMNSMKADMTGGATALAVLRAVAELKVEGLELHAFCAATPNMIDSDAMVPDSIVDTACGKKVEIRHTDAEGRLTLIDAVTMAEREQPELIVTIATLTGAAARAVGPAIALMSRQRSWRDRFEQAAELAGDPCFALDVVEEDFEDIASKLDGADISNVQKGKNRGAQTAAAFVMSGIKEQQPLLHLDIAGGDMTEDDRATGIAVKALLRFLLDLP